MRFYPYFHGIFQGFPKGIVMKIKHRYNSAQRQHYLLEAHYSFKLKPRLLYVGSLDKHGGWREEPHAHDFLKWCLLPTGTAPL